MKKSKYILALFGLTVLSWSCNKTPPCDCFEAAGNPAQEVRPLPYFDQVVATDDINVVVSIGSSEKVVIDGGSNLTHNIACNVSNNVLTLKNNNICNWLRSYRKSIITVYITMPKIGYLTNSGVGTISCIDTLKQDTLQLQTTNAGDINLMVNCSVIYGHLFGAGDLTLSGYSNQFLCNFFNGIGFVYCGNLNTSYTFISSTTTGDCYVNARSLLIAEIYQRGNIYYSGSPITIDKLGNGPGSLIKQ